jgi:sporadic carbohydrate cluster protein (TIGR04323 family)
VSDTPRRGYRGYVTSRGFGGYVIPVPVQSLVLRDYCARHGLLYVLPVNENIFPASYMVLEGMIENLAGFEGVVMCSMHMLPRRPERRQHIYDRILGQGCALRCALEDIAITAPTDLHKIEELLMLSAITAREPLHVALD